MRASFFLIDGHAIGGRHFDALIFGYWDGDRLMYAARTRSGFSDGHLRHSRFVGLRAEKSAKRCESLRTLRVYRLRPINRSRLRNRLMKSR
jgi:hypothetical protein